VRNSGAEIRCLETESTTDVILVGFRQDHRFSVARIYLRGVTSRAVENGRRLRARTTAGRDGYARLGDDRSQAARETRNSVVDIVARLTLI